MANRSPLCVHSRKLSVINRLWSSVDSTWPRPLSPSTVNHRLTIVASYRPGQRWTCRGRFSPRIQSLGQGLVVFARWRPYVVPSSTRFRGPTRVWRIRLNDAWSATMWAIANILRYCNNLLLSAVSQNTSYNDSDFAIGRVAWSFSLSVCLSVGYSRVLCKNGYRDAVWDGGPGCSRWHENRPGSFTGKGDFFSVLLLGRVVALHRAKAAYSHRTFPPTICWSVCLSVGPVHCGKTADRIWMRFGMVGQMGPGMRQVSWVWGSVHGRG